MMHGARTMALAMFLACSAAMAQEVAVKEAWVRATVPGQKATGAFMELTAKDDAVLVAASSPVAEAVEIHEMQLDDNIMRMRLVPRLDLPAGKSVEFRPGGYHVMLLDLKETLRRGDIVPVTLKVEGRDGRLVSIEVKAVVRDIAAMPGRY